jgi:hypothetical protein
MRLEHSLNRIKRPSHDCERRRRNVIRRELPFCQGKELRAIRRFSVQTWAECELWCKRAEVRKQ